MKDEETRIIQYLDSYAWGIDAEGKTICLGEEDAVRTAIANPELKSFDPAIDQIIELEREIIKEEKEDDGREIKRPGNIRSGLTRVAKHREANIRRTSAGKRVAFHKT